jgi:uncharacterized protein (DUF433 family)
MTPRITLNSHIHFGKPCIAGTRIPVHIVLELIREGSSFSEIIADYYQDIKVEDIRGCIQHAIDTMNLEQIHVASGP